MKKYPHGLTLNAVCAAIDDYQRHEDSVPEEGILAAFNTLLGRSDIADALRSMERTADVNMAAAQAMRDDMYHWKQRAEAAEAKLAELETQESTVEVTVDSRGEDHYTFTINRILPDGLYELFTRPAPAADLVELVTDDTKRMDWLVSMCVEVRKPLRYGSEHVFHAVATTDEEDDYHATTLREQIDAILRKIEEAE